MMQGMLTTKSVLWRGITRARLHCRAPASSKETWRPDAAHYSTPASSSHTRAIAARGSGAAVTARPSTT